jgi:hypothetical protein
MARHSLRVNGVGSGPDSIILCQEVAPDGFATTAVRGSIAIRELFESTIDSFHIWP